MIGPDAQLGDSPMYHINIVVTDENGREVGGFKSCQLFFPRDSRLGLSANGALNSAKLIEDFGHILWCGTLVRCLTAPANWAGVRPPAPAEPVGRWAVQDTVADIAATYIKAASFLLKDKR